MSRSEPNPAGWVSAGTPSKTDPGHELIPASLDEAADPALRCDPTRTWIPLGRDQGTHVRISAMMVKRRHSSSGVKGTFSKMPPARTTMPEGELEFKLLERNSRGVQLTTEGHAFLREAKIVVRHADHASTRGSAARPADIARIPVPGVAARGLWPESNQRFSSSTLLQHTFGSG
jgi:hypothetical protein